ncbi:8792_t:CDS:2, partial [Acaulospora morrowiae]
MPDRRKRSSEQSDALKYDEPPKFDKLPDIPRRFTRVMRFAELKKRNATNLTQKKRNKNQKVENSKIIQKLPGETMFDFSRRLDDQMRPHILKAMKEGSTAKDKTRRYREKVKQKKLEKRNKLYEELDAKDFGKFKDPVKFGEVVQAPPNITAIPKNRGSNARMSSDSNSQKLDVTNELKLIKEKNKQDRRQMNPGKKRLLE